MACSTPHTAHRTLHTANCPLYTGPTPAPAPTPAYAPAPKPNQTKPSYYTMNTAHRKQHSTSLYCMLHIYHLTLHTINSFLSWD